MKSQDQALVLALSLLAVIGLLGSSAVAQAVFAFSGVDLGAIHYVYTFAWFPHIAGSGIDLSAVSFMGLDFASILALFEAFTSAVWLIWLLRSWKR